MFTTAADFHHLRPFGVLAVFTAIFTAFFGRTVAGAVRAFPLVLFSHNGLFFSWRSKNSYLNYQGIQADMVRAPIGDSIASAFRFHVISVVLTASE